MYDIDVDQSRRIIRLRYIGFWTLDTVAAYYADLALKVRSLRPRHLSFAVLVDARDYPVQSQEVTDAMAQVSARGKSRRRGPTAVVVTSVLSKRQAGRVVPGNDARVFLNMDEAENWLQSEWCDRLAA